MKPKKLIPLLLGMFLFPLIASAQSWTPTTAPSLDWYSLASSADGSHLIAGSPMTIYTSTNAGLTWQTNNVPNATWTAVASSADGSILAAAVGYPSTGHIYISTNGGGAWVPSASSPSKQWYTLTMSADGGRMFASVPGVSGTTVYSSTDIGVTWVSNSASLYSPLHIVCSADGNTLALAKAGGAILTSTNYGTSWVSNNVNVKVFDAPTLGCSASGYTLIAAQGGNGGPICASTNLGVTWNTNGMRSLWDSIGVSADGHAAIVGSYPCIFTTTNSGASWISNNAPSLTWRAVTISADGSRMAAAGFPGGIYTWQATSSPAMNINLAPIGSNLTLSWVVPATNFVVQQSADLFSWSNAAITPTLNLSNLQEQVTLPVPAGSAFYRLKTP